MSGEPSLFSRASAEIVDLHRFFVDWFVAARANKADFSRFERVMGDGFAMVAPDGQILDRDAVVGHVRTSRATCDDGFAISIEDIRPGWQDAETIVVFYVEAQLRGGKHSRRQSSAVFTTSSSAPNGVLWRHLHETWLQVPELRCADKETSNPVRVAQRGTTMRKTILQLTTALALVTMAGAAQAADCKITVGLVMELTGPAGEYGQAGAKSVEMAFRDINAAGGVRGCDLATDTRDSQSQGNIAVDAATQLVQVKKVPVIIGGIISSVSIPILTSVTAPAKIVQVSPASSSPTLTALGRDGKTNGIFFRTITSDALQGVAAAKYAVDKGFKKLSIIHVNNDFGVNMVAEFSRAYKALGGTIVSDTPYNEKQSSYASEVTAAMAGEPDGLYLVSTPVDGATVARTWISQGGVQKFLLNDGMNSPDFIESVGADYLKDAYGTSSGTSPTASTDYFTKNYKEFSGIEPSNPAADRSYDAGAIVGLAIAIAGSEDPAKIKDAMYKAVDPAGTPIFAGKDEFAKALGLIKDGKPIRYEGVIGPVAFDKYGDITGPFRLWKIVDGKVTTDGEMTTDDVNALQAKLQ